MLYTIAVVLLVLWLLGLVSSYTLGGFIHACSSSRSSFYCSSSSRAAGRLSTGARA